MIFRIAKFLMGDSCIRFREPACLFPYFVSRDLLRPATSNTAVWDLNCRAVDPKRSGQAVTAHHRRWHMTVFGGYHLSHSLAPRGRLPILHHLQGDRAGKGREKGRGRRNMECSLFHCALSIANMPAFRCFNPDEATGFNRVNDH